jgi:hypothetical protein
MPGPSLTRRELLRSLPFLPPAAAAALDRLTTRTETPADLLWADPAAILRRAGYPPDRWQAAALADWTPRLLLLCSRQAGKSLTAAALALREALLNPPALVLLLSPTLRQSGELFRDKFLRLYDRIGKLVPARARTQLSLELTNGSRVVSLPENEEGVRGFSGVALLVIDEASRVSDDLYRAVRPMLATSGGRLVALSTPFGKRGWFHEEWDHGGGWRRVKVRADQCPRISAAFLASERLALGDRWYRQEYECSFEEAIGQVFSEESIRAALQPGPPPLFGG